MNAQAGWVSPKRDGDVLVLSIGGRWEVEFLKRLASDVAAELPPKRPLRHGQTFRIDADDLQSLDGSGAWLLCDSLARAEAAGANAELVNLKEDYHALYRRAEKAAKAEHPPKPRRIPVVDHLEEIGRAAINVCIKGIQLLNFLGVTVTAALRAMLKPWRIHFRAIITHLESSGLNAMPIIGLLTFLIGGVIAFIGAVQLRKFAAEVLTVDLVGITVLRELAVLITAILVAGRSGSAYTAQIGTMKVNEEIDAMQTIGIDPIDALVLPRLAAMVIALPLLTFYADIMGLLGGAVAAWMMLDLSFSLFINELKSAVDLTTFLVGALKAPFFGYIIAMVGCFEGLQVTGSAESVGQRTTMSVVESIFLVIVVDAIVAMTLAWLDI